MIRYIQRFQYAPTKYRNGIQMSAENCGEKPHREPFIFGKSVLARDDIKKSNDEEDDDNDDERSKTSA